MKRIHKALLLLTLGSLLAACGAMPAKRPGTELRFAVLGDAEPKPEPKFPNMAAAVADVNRLGKQGRIDYVVGVGDIAHKGTLIQYENATPVLQKLERPFYPIMGNEEHDSTVERFLEYANRWNQGKGAIKSHRYVIEHDSVALIFASPDHGRDFDDSGIAWLGQQIKRLQPKPVFLIVHGAQTGVYPENADKGVKHPGFAALLAEPNVSAVISGDLHMDMDRVKHSKQIGRVHYLHIPALERTKIPDASRHTPMFRVFSVRSDGRVDVETYRVGQAAPLPQHAYSFRLPARAAGK